MIEVQLLHIFQLDICCKPRYLCVYKIHIIIEVSMALFPATELLVVFLILKRYWIYFSPFQ